jgi:hypothetical protein
MSSLCPTTDVRAPRGAVGNAECGGSAVFGDAITRSSAAATLLTRPAIRAASAAFTARSRRESFISVEASHLWALSAVFGLVLSSQIRRYVGSYTGSAGPSCLTLHANLFTLRPLRSPPLFPAVRDQEYHASSRSKSWLLALFSSCQAQ